MKKFKKLIPAFCAMLLSACMLGTTTYAWFSVNKKVTATGLSVTAQANTQYFVISKTSTFTTNTIAIDNTGTNYTTVGGKEGKVYPAAYDEVTKQEGDPAQSVTKGIADKWWTANVNKHDSILVGDIMTPTELVAGTSNVYDNNPNYFIGYVFYLGLDKNSDAFKGQLQFKVDTATNAAKVAAVKFQQAVVEGSETLSNEQIVQAEGLANYKTSATEAEFYELSSMNNSGIAEKYVKVTVYVFIDGNNTLIRDLYAEGTLTGTIGIRVAAASENLQ